MTLKLMDKPYYDYDFDAAAAEKSKPKPKRKIKSASDVSSLLARFGFKTKLRGSPESDGRKKLTPGEAQKLVMEGINQQKK